MKILIAYVPVLHEGYCRLFWHHRDADICYIFGQEIVSQYPHLAKEIRALKPDVAQGAVAGLGVFAEVRLLDFEALAWLQDSKDDIEIVLPDEDICHVLADRYLPEFEVRFEGTVFLRWDRHKSTTHRPISPDQRISLDQFDRWVMSLAIEEGEKSSDWWRGVGAILVKGGEIELIRRNDHVPSPHLPYAEGDPRNDFKKGLNIELSTALHAEAAIVVEAAKRGLALERTDIYVSTFPCPPCAKLVAYSGIKKCYYSSGYAMLDGERILKQNGVEIIYVDMENPPFN